MNTGRIDGWAAVRLARGVEERHTPSTPPRLMGRSTPPPSQCGRWRDLEGRHATVDSNLSSDDKRTVVGRKVKNAICDVFRVTETAEGYL